MSKRKTHKERHNKRKRHSASHFMPAIQPNPTLNEEKIDQLPEIIVDCSADLSDNDIRKIKDRLNFADHRDLIKLNHIRIVDPDTIRTRSKESTTGCYYPKSSNRQAEIWLSSDLIKKRNSFENFFYRIAYKDKLFETLFHEIGHHKSRLTHSVDMFEGEAYAEKYMLAYRKYWKKYYGPSKLYIVVFKIFIGCIRFIVLGLLYPFKGKNKEINLYYRNMKGEITLKEFSEGLNELTNINETEPETRKKKWVHPLRKEKYRKRFKIPER